MNKFCLLISHYVYFITYIFNIKSLNRTRKGRNLKIMKCYRFILHVLCYLSLFILNIYLLTIIAVYNTKYV